MNPAELNIGGTVGDRNIEQDLVEFFAEGKGSHDAFLQRGQPGADHPGRIGGCGSHILGEIEQGRQGATGDGLAGLIRGAAQQGGGEQLLVASQLGFGLQHLELGGHAGLEAGPGIAQAHQRRPHPLLADLHLIVGGLEIEIGQGGLQTEVAQADQILVFGLLKLIACNGDLGGAGGVDQRPAGLQGRLHPPDTVEGRTDRLTGASGAVAELST